MSKDVKMSDIAGKLGVSTVTVSKALSGQKGVSDKVREEIKKLADEMGYVPIAARKATQARTSYNIGVLMADRFLGPTYSFYSQLYQKVASEAISNGSFTMMECISYDMEKTKDLPLLLKKGKVDGLIIIGRLSDDYVELLKKESNVPLMCLDFMDKKFHSDSVISDGYYGGYALTNYLIENGHRGIAYVGTVLATGSITDRYLGYTRALMEAGLPIRDDWVIPDRDSNTGKASSEEFFALPKEMPTAFFCNSDFAATLLIRKLMANGYKIPEDVSVVGYDNFPFPEMSEIGITSYDVDMKEMSRKAVRNLIHKMNGDQYRKGVQIVTGHIVEKESVRFLKR